MKLLVTRPVDDSLALKERLEQMGIAVVCAPLLEIKLHTQDKLNVQNAQAVLITSANGVSALVHVVAEELRARIRIFAVGEASAAAARKAGFTRVETAGGDSLSLAHLVRRRCQPSAGPLLHVSGQAVAGDLRGQLGAEGFDVRRIVLYDAIAATDLPGEAIAALRSGSLDGVLLYSARTARIFAQLIGSAGLTGALAGLTAYCLSPAVADALAGVRFKSIRIAPVPREQDLLNLISGG